MASKSAQGYFLCTVRFIAEWLCAARLTELLGYTLRKMPSAQSPLFRSRRRVAGRRAHARSRIPKRPGFSAWIAGNGKRLC
jgi:hypothetical protein